MSFHYLHYQPSLFVLQSLMNFFLITVVGWYGCGSGVGWRGGAGWLSVASVGENGTPGVGLLISLSCICKEQGRRKCSEVINYNVYIQIRFSSVVTEENLLQLY